MNPKEIYSVHSICFPASLMAILCLLIFSVSWVASSPPNVVFILTDDQDVFLNGLTPLEKTRKLIGQEGSIFSNAFATTPICCPSRSSILTGLYPHIHGTVNNSLEGGCSDAHWQRKREPNTFGAVLHRAGYTTFYAGKYLNRYGFKSSGGLGHVPEGWDWWIGLVGNSAYYNYTLSVNGSRLARGDDESDYLTDVLKEYCLTFLNERARREEPFLMVVSTPAPHEPFTPARRHVGRFSNLAAPRTPNFNQPVRDGKHWLLRLPPASLPEETIFEIDRVFRNRWETLLAVDELVEAVVKRLSQLQLLDDTFVIFSSDHGFHLGQFGQPWDKRQPYETDLRIPLMMRGPKVIKGTKIRNPVLNVDIAPTILDVAGIASGRKTSGRSFLSIATSEPEANFSRTFLVEYWGEGRDKGSDCYGDPNVKLCLSRASCKCFDSRNNTFHCLRHLSVEEDDLFCRFDDSESFREFYDLKRDPYQMINLSGARTARRREIVLEDCLKRIRSKKPMDDCFHRRGIVSST